MKDAKFLKIKKFVILVFFCRNNGHFNKLKKTPFKGLQGNRNVLVQNKNKKLIKKNKAYLAKLIFAAGFLRTSIFFYPCIY